MSIFSQFNFSLIQFDWVLFVLPIPFYIGMLLDTLAWKTMLLPVKMRIRNLFGIQIGAESVLLSIPGGFAMTDPIKLYILKQSFHIPPSEVLGSLITRHWLLGITQLFFICSVCVFGFFVSQHQLLISYVHDGTLFIAIGVLICISIGLGVIVRRLMCGTLARGVWKFLYAINIRTWRERLKRMLSSFKEADCCFAELGKRNASAIVTAAMFYLFLWTMDIWETMLVAHTTGFHISFLNALLIEGILSAARLSMFFLPGGIVVKEIGYYAIFTSLHLSLSPGQIGAFVLVKRLVSILCIVIGYFVLFAQGIKPIWKRKFLSYQTIMESR